MKKSVLMFVLVVSMVSGLNAQVRGNAIGLRMANQGNGGELSFQAPLSKANRLELDLGLNNWKGTNHGCELTGVYQWVWGLNQVASGLNWYAGLGATAGSYSSDLGFGVVGQIGLEFNFNIPLQISLDWRPTLFNSYYNNYGGNGLSIRYRF